MWTPHNQNKPWIPISCNRYMNPLVLLVNFDLLFPLVLPSTYHNHINPPNYNINQFTIEIFKHPSFKKSKSRFRNCKNFAVSRVLCMRIRWIQHFYLQPIHLSHNRSTNLSNRTNLQKLTKISCYQRILSASKQRKT